MEINTGKTALITGASSGIGFELARCFARDGFRLIMVAHYRGKLQEAADKISKEFPEARIEPIAVDLSKDNAPEKLYSEVEERGLHLDILVNNAGFGEYGPFSESNLQKELAMIHLNVISLVHLTKLFLPDMLDRNTGKILQVGSVASFMPAPLQSVYGATKAFILSFSEALQEELKGTGVSITVLCPPATDTNFFNVAGAQDSKLARGNLATPEEVAASGYSALMKGEARAVPTLKGKLEVAAGNILPDSVMATAMHKLTEEVKPKKTAPKKASTPKESTVAAATPAPETATNTGSPSKRGSGKTNQTEPSATQAPAKTSSRKKKE